MDITLLIPTLNRSDHLIRLLQYYRDLEFRGRISIGDSSDEHHKQRAKETVKKLQDDLNIVYQEYPGLNISECMQRLAQSATTPYVCWMADDDFLVPSGVQQCVDFLDHNPDYTAAHGLGAAILVEGNRAYGEIGYAQHYGQPVLEAATGSKRLVDFLSQGSTSLFSVHRAEVWRAMFSEVAPVPDPHLQGEWIPGSLSVIHGKNKGLDGLYMVRQIYGRRPPLYSDIYEWFFSDDWHMSYGYLRSRLAEELARQDNIGVAEAQEVVKKAWWNYIQRTLHNAWEMRYGQKSLDLRTRLRRVALQTPGLYRGWHRVRSLMGRVDQFSLPSLLRPNSPYHKEFMPIYRAVTNGPTSGTLDTG